MGRLIYLDSCLVIYQVEKHPVWSDRVDAMMAGSGDAVLVLSGLVKAECLVRPIRSGDRQLQLDFQTYFAGSLSLDLPEPAFLAAADLRARFNLKMPDALHLACARHHGCAALWTNDSRLSAAGGDLVRVLAPQ